MYSDLFVAAPGEAALVAANEGRFEVWHSVSLKNVLELEWLAFARAARTDVFEEALVENRSCVVRAMTRHVVARLAGLDASAQRELATAWKAEAEGFVTWPVEAVERVVAELRALAGRASREGKAVLYLASW